MSHSSKLLRFVLPHKIRKSSQVSQFAFRSFSSSLHQSNINQSSYFHAVKSFSDNSVILEWKKENVENEQKINNIWLRDHCKCPSCIDKQTGQKLVRIAELARDESALKITKATMKDSSHLQLAWGDGHESLFHTKWLYMNTTSEARREMVEQSRMLTWDKRSMKTLPSVNYADIVDVSTDKTRDEGLFEWLEQLSLHGFCIVNDVPTEATNKVNEFVQRISYIQNSIYGPDWEVKVDPGHVNVAYTNIELGIHMDLCYYESPPGFQFLHCLRQSPDGGENFVVDLFKIAEDMRCDHPQQFDMLKNTRISFHNGSLYTNHVYYRRPIFELNEETNEIQSIYFSPYWEAPFNIDQDKAAEFYEAFILWNRMIKDDKYVVEFKLRDGQVLSFNNRRVGHGRRSFESTSARHLQGTYISTDEFANKYRMLRKNLGKKECRLRNLGNASHEFCVEPMESELSEESKTL